MEGKVKAVLDLCGEGCAAVFRLRVDGHLLVDVIRTETSRRHRRLGQED